MKKVAFLFHDTDYYSGGTRSLLDLIDIFQADEKMTIYAIVPNHKGSAIDYLHKKNIEIIYSEYFQINYLTDEGILRYIYRFPKRLKKNIKNYLTAPKLAKILVEKNIDCIYSNTGFIITGALIKRLVPNIRHVWHIREFGEEDHHFGVFFGRNLYYYLLNKYTDSIVVISKALYNKFRVHVTKPQISIIYDDVSLKYYQRISAPYCEGERMRILMAGLICDGKGQVQAIKAIKRLKERGIPAELLIAGQSVNQKYLNYLNEYIDNNDLSQQIHFLGLVQDMNTLRSKVTFGIVASKSEAFGRVTIEGMLSGMLMIGADAGGTKELIDNGETGFLYPSENYIKLAEILEELFYNPDLVNEIRFKGQEYALKFTKGQCAEKLERILLL